MNHAYSNIPSLSQRFPKRSSGWQLRTRFLKFGKRPAVMGIVNVTPDSFSDGGRFSESHAAVEHALQLAADGADILDIGGESTRPYADQVAAEDELKRVLPVIQRLSELTDVPISVDTSKAKVAQEAIQAGAEILNDVTGLAGDPHMLDLAVETAIGVCAMHMQGTPQTMQDNPIYQDVVEDIFHYLKSRRDHLISAGIHRDQICLDPGIGFGKTHQHNLTLMAACGRFHDLECPILIGHSRKGFIARVLKDKTTDRTAATVGASMVLAQNGIQVIRVHDVLANVHALQLFEASGGIDGEAIQIE